MTSRPVGQEEDCLLVVDLHPGNVKDLTRVVTQAYECYVPQRLNSLRYIYVKG